MDPKPKDLGDDINPETGNFIGDQDRFDRLRVVAPSDTPSADADDLRNVYRSNFQDQTEKVDPAIEIEKSDEERAIIVSVNQITSQLQSKYGAEQFDIPIENIHIIDPAKWRAENSVALFSTLNQNIRIPRKEFMSEFALVLAHEILHFKSYLAAQHSPDRDHQGGYRMGLQTVSIKDDTNRLIWMNEGITEMLATKIFDSIESNNLFAREQSDREQVIEWGVRELDLENILAARITPLGNGTVNIKTCPLPFNYLPETRGASLLVQDLFNKNESRFESRKDVEDMFYSAMFNGNMLGVAKLIDRTYGKGTFRELAETDESSDYLDRVEQITGTRAG